MAFRNVFSYDLELIVLIYFVSNRGVHTKAKSSRRVELEDV